MTAKRNFGMNWVEPKMKKKQSEIVKETYEKVAEEVARNIRPKMNKTKMTNKKLKEEFKKRFGEDYIISICESSDAGLDDIWDFIETALKEKEKEISIKIERMKKKHHKKGIRKFTYNHALDDILKLLDSINGKKT